MRANEFCWADYSNLNQDVAMTLLEAFALNKNLLEELDQDVLTRLNLLRKYCAEPKINKSYIPIPIYVVKDKVHALDSNFTSYKNKPKFIKLLNIDGNKLTFLVHGKEVPWSIDHSSENLYRTILLCDNEQQYNNVISHLNLAFDIELTKI